MSPTFRPIGGFGYFFLIFILSSGGWVKVKRKLPHFHVSDTSRVSIKPNLPLQQHLSDSRHEEKFTFQLKRSQGGREIRTHDQQLKSFRRLVKGEPFAS